MTVVIGATALAAALVVGCSLFWAWGVVQWRLKRAACDGELPRVSVLIAGRNEAAYIRGTLQSVLRCNYPVHLLEVIFIDDHSGDQTVAEASSVAEQSAGRLRLVHAPDVPEGRSPKKNALSFGIQQARGEILVFTDADSEVQPDWIRCMVRSYDRKTGAVAGATIPKAGGGWHHRLYRLERFVAALSSASAIGHDSPASVTGQNFSFRRRVYEEIGGHAHPEVASGDDDLMAQEIARRGWQVRFCAEPESVVTDSRPPTVPGHLAAASRHQSTIRFYPWRWRLAYLITILAGWTLLAGGLFSLSHPGYFTIFVPVVAGKLLIDSLGVQLFSRRLQIRLTFFEFVCTEIILPFYVILRPLWFFRSSYDWHGRTHQALVHPSADIPS